MSKICSNCHHIEEQCMCNPEGATCVLCAYFAHCKRMYAVKEDNTWCDFFPVRFRLSLSARTAISEEIEKL